MPVLCKSCKNPPGWRVQTKTGNPPTWRECRYINLSRTIRTCRKDRPPHGGPSYHSLCRLPRSYKIPKSYEDKTMTKISVYSADNSFLIIEAENHFVYYKTAVPNNRLISRLASIQIKVWFRSFKLFSTCGILCLPASPPRRAGGDFRKLKSKK
ncbi:MAG: hypothetical protein ACYCVH_12830 [Ignavibacteriaceae bacterium]